MDDELSYYLALAGVKVERMEPDRMDGLCAVWLPSRKVVQVCEQLCPGRRKGVEARIMAKVTDSILG